MAARTERRNAGRMAMENWKRERTAMIEQRKQNNVMIEQGQKEEMAGQGKTNNPWTRINSFCNFSET